MIARDSHTHVETFFLSLLLSIKTLGENGGQNKIYSKISNRIALRIILLIGDNIPITSYNYKVSYRSLLNALHIIKCKNIYFVVFLSV